MEIHATGTGTSPSQKPFLLPVEKRIIELYQEGKSPVDISKALNISIRLVETKLNEFAPKQQIVNHK